MSSALSTVLGSYVISAAEAVGLIKNENTVKIWNCIRHQSVPMLFQVQRVLMILLLRHGLFHLVFLSKDESRASTMWSEWRWKEWPCLGTFFCVQCFTWYSAQETDLVKAMMMPQSAFVFKLCPWPWFWLSFSFTTPLTPPHTPTQWYHIAYGLIPWQFFLSRVYHSKALTIGHIS